MPWFSTYDPVGSNISDVNQHVSYLTKLTAACREAVDIQTGTYKVVRVRVAAVQFSLVQSIIARRHAAITEHFSQQNISMNLEQLFSER